MMMQSCSVIGCQRDAIDTHVYNTCHVPSVHHSITRLDPITRLDFVAHLICAPLSDVNLTRHAYT